jgi:uncharacterized protein
MIMTIALWIIAVLLMLIGLVGSVLPALPGTPLIFCGVLIAAWINSFQDIGVFTLVFMGIVTLLTTIIDYAISGVSVKRAGASTLGIIGAVIGTIAGVFSGLWGLLWMPLVGAAFGEFITHTDLLRAGKIGLATWIGLVVSTALKVAVAFMMIGVFLLALVF